MNLRKGLTFTFPVLIIAILLLCVGTAAAQHEGGLGERKIHLNLADTDQLMKIEGMTPELADAIVAYRENAGFFKKPEDLLQVPGMTQETYEKLNPQVGSEGDLYCVPKPGTEDEDEEEEPLLSPSKC